MIVIILHDIRIFGQLSKYSILEKILPTLVGTFSPKWGFIKITLREFLQMVHPFHIQNTN